MSAAVVRNVLFLCTGNSARSVMAEALLNHWGKGRFHAYSAGSHPKQNVHPLTLEQLQAANLPTAGLRSKSWDEFAAPAAPKMDLIITVCDNAAGEICPIWPGRPITAHWGFPDPAAADGTMEQKRRAFSTVYRSIEARIKLLCALPPGALDGLAAKARIDRIGQGETVS